MQRQLLKIHGILRHAENIAVGSYDHRIDPPFVENDEKVIAKVTDEFNFETAPDLAGSRADTCNRRGTPDHGEVAGNRFLNMSAIFVARLGE